MRVTNGNSRIFQAQSSAGRGLPLGGGGGRAAGASGRRRSRPRFPRRSTDPALAGSGHSARPSPFRRTRGRRGGS
jgi:hypothetical protein